MIKEIINWIKNKKTIEEEQKVEDKQYNDVLIQIGKLRKDLQKANEETEHQRKLKEIYLGNCRRLKRKLREVEDETNKSRGNSKESTNRKQKSKKR